jgi:hypothetical protein
MNMNRLGINTNTLALGLALSAVAFLGFAFSNGALAESMSKTDYNAGKDKITAGYQLAKAGCAPLSGNPNDSCEAGAKVRMKTWTAKPEADEKSAEALREANKQAADARKDVTSDELNAQYQVAKERCDSIAGDAKVFCVMEAKARFGKS